MSHLMEFVDKLGELSSRLKQAMENYHNVDIDGIIGPQEEEGCLLTLVYEVYTALNTACLTDHPLQKYTLYQLFILLVYFINCIPQ